MATTFTGEFDAHFRSYLEGLTKKDFEGFDLYVWTTDNKCYRMEDPKKGLYPVTKFINQFYTEKTTLQIQEIRVGEDGSAIYRRGG